MKLLILESKRRNPYSDYFEQQLILLLKENNHFIRTPFGIAPSTLKDTKYENEIFVRTHAANKISVFLTSFKVRFFTKKQNIDWLLLLGHKNFFSSKLPQILIPDAVEKISLQEPIANSSKIVIGSITEKDKLLTLYPFAEKHVHIVPFSASQGFQPVSWSEQQALKLELTQGREFFLLNLTNTSLETFTNLLKAFTTFKKWQQSNMKLVIRGISHRAELSELKEKLSNYKYREDVVLPDDVIAGKEYITILSSAYAFLHLPSAGDDVVPLLQAMQCEIPCITFTTAIIEEYTDNAALLIEHDNYEQLSEKLILLYKDENLRSKLIGMGKQKAQAYSAMKAHDALVNLLPANVH